MATASVDSSLVAQRENRQPFSEKLGWWTFSFGMRCGTHIVAAPLCKKGLTTTERHHFAWRLGKREMSGITNSDYDQGAGEKHEVLHQNSIGDSMLRITRFRFVSLIRTERRGPTSKNYSRHRLCYASPGRLYGFDACHKVAGAAAAWRDHGGGQRYDATSDE